ncbi:IS66 family transposase [Marinoscillum furvescens]|uniref:Transposase IS166 family protein n=1 Tax=Marinoscillum furvescens DSM 4134 TaxID=1122208 RepID=A0A3D9LFW1_MARFU|nr:hypothetical protein [Marinoscillum furvescens]REE05487.1 transposase IS166 family protein [Marinoscillum furvescens DSM 4134]
MCLSTNSAIESSYSTGKAVALPLESNEIEPEAEQQTISYTKEKKAKKKPIRMVLPAHLPREEEVLEPEDKQDNAEKLDVRFHSRL